MAAILIDRFVLPPARCAICWWGGSSEERQIIDTRAAVLERLVDGRLMEDGRLYVCGLCATEMASVLRFVPPDMADRFVAERDAAIARVKELELELETLKTFRDLAEAFRPAPEVTLEATPRNQCPDCDFTGQNRGALAQHRRMKHGAPVSVTLRGDEVLQSEEVDA